MSTPAHPLAPPDNSDDAARARGEVLAQELAARGIPLESLERDRELSPEETAATRDERYLRLAAWIEAWEKEPHADEPDWDVDELFPPDRVR